MSKKTAIVLIHGIGEQRPMETLHSFVSNVITPVFRSKPDRLSALYDVRRLSCGIIDDQDIDCYELYWAHHLRDSRLWHLLAWMFKLLMIPFCDLKKMSQHSGRFPYRKVKLLGWMLIALVLAVAVATSPTTVGELVRGKLGDWLGAWPWAVGIVGKLRDWLGAWPWAVGIIGLVVIVGKILQSVAQRWLVTTVGDVARYFDSRPDNIEQRHAIRHQCAEFLHTLSQSTNPQYDRIVVVGHSLGSVIAYDALKVLWAALPENEKKASLADKKWKFSDLVTVGSPLVHAPLLLAGSMDTFKNLQEQRELPTCPPQVDPSTGLYGWIKKGWIRKGSYYLHHAALFTVTKWTNYYLEGDPIGGPLSPLFGNGVKDVALDDGVTWWKWRNHTRYWGNGRKKGSDRFRQEIKQII